MTVTALQQHDFSGYATKANLKCTDGRTIMPDAFQHMDGQQVPLVWQHGHKDVTNVLGHAILEARPDGVYCKGYFNDTQYGQAAKALVQHKDIKALSIFANQLVERSKQVFHGMIKEVSLCIGGANPGAFIDNVVIAHADGELETLDDAILISAGESLDFIFHADDEPQVDDEDADLAHATLQEVYDTLDEDQKNLVNYMIGAALEGVGQSDAEHSDNPGDTADDNSDEGDLEHQEGSTVTRNVFEQQGTAGGATTSTGRTLTHDDMRSIAQTAVRIGSLKEALKHFAHDQGVELQHGITDIELLFPEAKNLSNTPEWNKRRTEWVSGVLSGTSKTPFSRVRSLVADITMESARALGYIKGNLKKEEWFSLTRRSTSPTTIYKKQKLDRDDIIDIVDLDVVNWLKGEMRLMLEEEIARAILIGDGRPVDDPANPGEPNPDKILDPAAITDGKGIRSILHEHELYATTAYAPVDETQPDAYRDLVEEVMMQMENYKGSGSPTFYTTQRILTRMLLTKDGQQRRLWSSKADLAAEMGVANIVPVEVFSQEPDLVGIIVNLTDYNVGADKGGELNFFEDFDIDYNQHKYLGETRLSGALTKIKSALIIKKVAGNAVLVSPTEPTFNSGTGVVTIPTVTGVVYKNAVSGATLSAGAQSALSAGASLYVQAFPATSGYYFEDSDDDEWTFTRDA